MIKINEDKIRKYIDAVADYMEEAGHKETVPGIINEFQDKVLELTGFLRVTAKAIRDVDPVKDPIRLMVLVSILKGSIGILNQVPVADLMDQVRQLILANMDCSRKELAAECEVLELELRLKLFGPQNIDRN